MSKVWQVHEARSRFSEFLEASVSDGRQIVTKLGVETAVLLPGDQWRGLRDLVRLTLEDRPTSKELLLSPDARIGALVPFRARHRHRR